MQINRFSIYWVELDPTKGSEIKKTRPCLIVSPTELNKRLNTVIILPITSSGQKYPFRAECLLEGKVGLILVDQIRTVDKTRLKNKIIDLDSETSSKVSRLLKEMFDI